ncbi:GHMP family kinase ATP-binding protein [Actinomadura macrotermitis]|uniref:Galactokinase n=1 Tax=Actinomadura macrotermitis TaxID=2585200 RepID=A0A7K0C460_9ACTN|nr:hypothetical protein [Actinomadura macrotermitis]MQY08225.1 Galactokinase [Actinomadura macrotermitis]
MTSTEERGVAQTPAADPELRLTAYVFERAFGAAPVTVRRARGGLTLLSGPGASLAVALPWGATVAAGPGEDGTAELFSMNLHGEHFFFNEETRPDDIPSWAEPAVTALRARSGPIPGVRLVTNGELPAETGLLSGGEMACAVGLALGDLYGPEHAAASVRDPAHAVSLAAREAHAVLTTGDGARTMAGGPVPCDLAGAGLRLMIMDVAAAATASPPAPLPGLVERAAAALDAGDPAALGPLLTEARTRQGVLPDRVLDAALDTARAAGALGGLAIGRCAVALVPMAVVPRVRAEVTARLAGSAQRPPRFLTVVPAGA